MAGGFVHITAVAFALQRLGQVAGLTPQDKQGISQFQPLFEIGAVGPDYPYLGQQSEWADRMHYQRTGEVIRNGVRVLRGYGHDITRTRCLAWLMGYAAHVATDLTIHPIVELRVGPYAENKTQHRTCEMHQDAYIWPQRNLGEIGLADAFRLSINACSDDDGNLEDNVASFWRRMLEATYPEDAANDAPQFDHWNKGFKIIVDAIDDAGSLFCFTRHLLAEGGLVYPAANRIDRSFIDNLNTPEGPLPYDAVFDRAVSSIVQIWSTVGEALTAAQDDVAEERLASLPDGDLDTGRTLAGGDMIFWREA